MIEVPDGPLHETVNQHLPQTPLHALLGLRALRVDRELVVIEMPVRDEAFNSSGNLHGGALATLVDVTAGLAAAVGSTAYEPGTNTIVTADLHLRYLGRPRTETVRAEARVLRSGRQLVVVECQVLDGEDRVIVAADFSSMVVPLREPLRVTSFGDPSGPDL